MEIEVPVVPGCPHRQLVEERLGQALDGAGFTTRVIADQAEAERSGQFDKAVEGLDARVTALEKARWSLPTVGVLTSLAALGLAAWSALGR